MPPPAVAVSIASSSANTPGPFVAVGAVAWVVWSQSLLRQRILPDCKWRGWHDLQAGVSIASSSANTPGPGDEVIVFEPLYVSQSLLRQRILPDMSDIVVDYYPNVVSIASSSANTPGPSNPPRYWRETPCLNRFFVSEYSRTITKETGGIITTSSQSLLRQRILPDIQEYISTNIVGELSQSLLRQRILPDTEPTACRRRRAFGLNRFFVSEYSR